VQSQKNMSHTSGLKKMTDKDYGLGWNMLLLLDSHSDVERQLNKLNRQVSMLYHHQQYIRRDMGHKNEECRIPNKQIFQY
jgi:hypothetical protein